jgi:hypothetical protein
VLVTSCDPLRIYLFNNGLVRLSAHTYEVPTRINAVRDQLWSGSLEMYDRPILDQSAYAPNQPSDEYGKQRQ